MISKTKDRRLFLTNDLVMCVSVVPKSGDDFLQHSERLSLKWAYPVQDVEVLFLTILHLFQNYSFNKLVLLLNNYL